MPKYKTFSMFNQFDDDIKSVISSFISEQDICMLLAFDPILASNITCKDTLNIDSKLKDGRCALVYLLVAMDVSLHIPVFSTKEAFKKNKKRYYKFVSRLKKKTNKKQFSDIYKQNILPPNRKCKKIIKYLLENGADPNYSEYLSHLPLTLATHISQLDIVKLLLKFKADPNKIGFDPKNVTFTDLNLIYTPLAQAVTMCKYSVTDPECYFGKVKKENFRIIKTLFEAGADPNLTTYYPNGEVSGIQFDELLSHDTKLINDNSEMQDILNMFLKYGADMNTKLSFVNTLMCDDSAFFYLIQTGCANCVKLFIDNGVDVNKVCDRLKQNGITKVIIKCNNSDDEMITMLYNAGCDINHKDGIGETPLHSAVSKRNISDNQRTILKRNIRTLLKLGAKIDRSRNIFGKTVLVNAVERLDLDILKLILENGGKEFINDKELEDEMTPLMMAITALGSDPVFVHILLENGADPNIKSKDGSSALIYACQESYFMIHDMNYDVVKALLEKGADPHLENNEGFTALDYARSNNWTEIVNMIEYHIEMRGRVESLV